LSAVEGTSSDPWYYAKPLERAFIVLCHNQTSKSLLPTFYQGCRVEPTRIDYTRLQEWLDHCQTTHPNTCAPQVRNKRMSITFIDCTSRTLIDSEPNGQCFALSYVWGDPPSDVGNCANEIQSFKVIPPCGVPQGIEDALLITLRFWSAILVG
jgi:hypothetical protein